jgi:hypothetical protein
MFHVGCVAAKDESDNEKAREQAHPGCGVEFVYSFLDTSPALHESRRNGLFGNESAFR